MIRELTCIGCPMGCSLSVAIEETGSSDGPSITVTGNTCGIGKRYAEQEVTAPTRMVTTTVLNARGMPVPVKTQQAIPKDKIFDVVTEIKSAKIGNHASIGQILIPDVAGTGIPVVITGNI